MWSVPKRCGAKKKKEKLSWDIETQHCWFKWKEESDVMRVDSAATVGLVSWRAAEGQPGRRGEERRAAVAAGRQVQSCPCSSRRNTHSARVHLSVLCAVFNLPSAFPRCPSDCRCLWPQAQTADSAPSCRPEEDLVSSTHYPPPPLPSRSHQTLFYIVQAYSSVKSLCIWLRSLSTSRPL